MDRAEAQALGWIVDARVGMASHSDGRRVEVHADSQVEELLLGNIAELEGVPDRIGYGKVDEVVEGFVDIRAHRDKLLRETDWTQLLDAPITPEKQTEWTTYRQALRDLPDAITNPRDPVSWPTIPT